MNKHFRIVSLVLTNKKSINGNLTAIGCANGNLIEPDGYTPISVVFDSLEEQWERLLNSVSLFEFTEEDMALVERFNAVEAIDRWGQYEYLY